MNDKLEKIIQVVKLELNKNPNGIIIGKIRDGNLMNIQNCNSNIQSYYDFLKVCDGARCGAIDLFYADMLDDYQFVAEMIPGGKEKWFYIGQILYEPLVINKANSKVYRFYRDNVEDMPRDCFGTFDEFLLNYVFGKKYSEIIPDVDDDDWFQMLIKLNLV